MIVSWTCSYSPRPRQGPSSAPKGVSTLPIIKISTTLREAPVLAKAMDEYREHHPELHYVFRFRLQELADALRRESERGLKEEAEQEARRWGKR